MWVSLKGFEFCGDLSFGEVEVTVQHSEELK